MGGIRMKARGSTVNLITPDASPGNGELPLEVGEGMTNQLFPCPPCSFLRVNKVSKEPNPVDIRIPLNSLRRRLFGVRDPDFHLGQLKKFSWAELRIATDNFREKNILGRGGFGDVYRGRLADGSLVAVKRLNNKSTQGEMQSQTEVKMHSMAVHRNLLRLRGFCKTKKERLLVYPYMANGSVASWLRERRACRPPLDWRTRKRIALGCARGLSYLHDYCAQKIVHLDVKPHNILLDEEFQVVIGDFGLAIVMEPMDTDVTTDGICGTVGYIAPEYLSTGNFSEKVDVFSYGIMLLELITGRKPSEFYQLANDDDDVLVNRVRKVLLKEMSMEMLVDADLEHNYVEAEVEELIQLAVLCTLISPSDRPKMSDVVRKLECAGLVEIECEWQNVEFLHPKLQPAHSISSSTIYSDQVSVELSCSRDPSTVEI
ncbi:hypothetical protein FNV43_RR12539 [Rhamnella rubrinervis]|uniref:non-specific serine/threonine protein kinase n=1 Tax=Rhamnella rubrinervis TaxID=2594499 RepID=A0A8K0MIW8_9ROSA|nr:hypothetical protein FNV43_RR12539 [Rhamnella rubrinervis]